MPWPRNQPPVAPCSASTRHDRVALSIYLCTVLHDATADLYRLNPHDAPDPRALFDRFLGWAPRGDPGRSGGDHTGRG